MMLTFYFILSVLTVCQATWEDSLFNREKKSDVGDSTFATQEVEFSRQSRISSTIDTEYENGTSVYRSGDVNFNSLNGFSSETYKREELNISTSDNNQSTSLENATAASNDENTPTASSTNKVGTVTDIFNNNSLSITSDKFVSSHSSEAVFGTAKPGTLSTSSSNDSSTELSRPSSAPDEEPEGVVISKPSPSTTTIVTSFTKSIYQKSLELINDAYTLSILVPVAAGVIFATSIIITIAVCKCLRRRCWRRRFRRKALPDSVKNLRPSDRARLLAESSDEEF